MIIDEKVIMYPPPPSYATSTAPPYPASSTRITLTTLPSHLLLQIVYLTFPQQPGVDEGKPERQRKTLLWLAAKLRLVNRAFYIACMHVLRSTYLPSYNLQLRPPYTSDPFPAADPSLPSYSATPTNSPLSTLQRETIVLDKYIALKVREDVFQDDSELHLEREDAFRDLFDLMQPRARLEDLVRYYGVHEGVVTLNSGGSSRSSPVNSRNGSTTTLPSPSTSTPRKGLSSFFSSFKSSSKSKQPPSPTQTFTPQTITPLPFSMLVVTLSPRRVGLVLTSQGQRRTIVEVPREGREESLEVAAKNLVRGLREWLTES